MNKEDLCREIERFVEESPLNRVDAADAIEPSLAGLRLYDAPLIGFSAAKDRLYTEVFKQEGVISPEYQTPCEWLPEAETVISFFLPFSEEVRRSNRSKTDVPYEAGLPQRASAAWLHARIEGQAFIDALTDHLERLLQASGLLTVCPTTSGRLRMITPYISTWSERHAAFVAGLGTFGLSRGLITKKGMAGRIGSVITDGRFEADERPYRDPFEYCIRCGACVDKCPVEAIDMSRGMALAKDQLICGPYMQGSRLPAHGPRGVIRYGCGKCQVGVPCEDRIPGRSC